VISKAMLEVGVSAATDVTGFGLIGHLLEMLEDRLSAELRFEAIPVLEEAFDLVEQGVLPGGSKRNYDAARDRVDAAGLDRASKLVLFDAQTSGGLLIAVPPARASALLAALDERGVKGHPIGNVVTGDGRITVS
jgi:selenide,water dikinase